MKRTAIFRVWLILAGFLAFLSASAETKVVERSAKKAPEWVGGVAEGFLVVNVRAHSLDDAQTQALQKITEQILMSVASNVSVSQNNLMTETTRNGRVDSNDSFTKRVAINAAKLPYMKGITLAKAADVYWERKIDKKTKQEFYDYAVKYPFPPSERRRLIYDFEEYDASMSAELDRLEEALASTVSVEGINNALASLDALQEYFVDDVRAAKVSSLRQRYKDIYKNVTVYGGCVAPGVLECGLQVNGYRFFVPTVAKVTSNCARIISTTQSEGVFKINFDASDCLPDEVNTITTTFRIGDRKLEQTFEITPIGSGSDKASFAVVPSGKVYLSAGSSSAAERTLSDISVRLTLDNKGGTPFGVKALELKVPELASEIVLDNLDLVFTTPGLVEVNAMAEGSFRVSEMKSTTTSFVTGALTVVNPDTGAVERIRLTLPYTTNWNK